MNIVDGVGLAELASRKYKSAAKNFLQSSFDNCECPEVSSKLFSFCLQLLFCTNMGVAFFMPNSFHVFFFCIFQIISPNNVAIYGGLCALATFERQELQKKVLSSRYSI